LKKSMTCKRCGTPYILPDGRRVDEVAATRPGAAPPPAYVYNGPVYSIPSPTAEGTNWISIARWMTIGYGALSLLALLAVGFLFQHITVPVQDPASGRLVDETVNIRPFLAIAAVMVVIIFALIAWLTRFAVARIILLMLVGLEAVGTLARIGGEPASAVLGTLIALMLDAGFAFVLVMSFLPPRAPRPPPGFAQALPAPGTGPIPERPPLTS
jgi:hypothetical protein